MPLKSGGRKDILRGVSGAVLPARLLAIMGSSGAGKTTLLDVLACNPQPGGRAGDAVLVNGAPRKVAAFQRQSCYVLQREVLLASATVREAVATSALLKLPRALGADRLRRADAVLEELGLTGFRDTLIGDELLGMKGVSGGQRRRVAIGIELVKVRGTALLRGPPRRAPSLVSAPALAALLSPRPPHRTCASSSSTSRPLASTRRWPWRSWRRSARSARAGARSR